MAITRRGLLAGLATGAVAAAGCSEPVRAREPKELPPNAVGLLFDSTLCVGCKACVTACRQANGTSPEFSGPEKLWDTPRDLSARTLTVIKAYADGAADRKDQETDGFAFVKKSCLHCVDASCVSVCPVSAMTKDPDTGIVNYNRDICIGCRYCVEACPFGVPRFEYDTAFPRLRKCELCRDRQAQGGIPACAEVCPTGATLFGPVTALKAEAERRVALAEGAATTYPRNRVESTDVHERPAPRYVRSVYGEKEVGGTQVLFLAGVPFDKLGYPELPETPYVATSETIQHTLYKGMIAPVALFCGLLCVAFRTAGPEPDKKEH